MRNIDQLLGNPTTWLVGGGAAFCAFGTTHNQQTVGVVLLSLGIFRWFLT